MACLLASARVRAHDSRGMKQPTCHTHWGLLVVSCMLAASLASAAPSIQITNVPAFATFGSLSGVVSIANPASQRVAVFIYVGGGWYSKPSCAEPLTAIQPDGSWTANITPVGFDVNATIIAALLVSSNYNQACVQGAAGLPTAVSQAALASAYVTRFNPAARQFTFCDYAWWVKNSVGTVGPGPIISRTTRTMSGLTPLVACTCASPIGTTIGNAPRLSAPAASDMDSIVLRSAHR